MNGHESDAEGQSESRRSFITKGIYVVPLVLSLKAEPAFASYGSGKPVDEKGNNEHHNNEQGNNEKGNNGLGNGIDPQPPGNPPVNGGPGTSPGQSGRHR